MNNWIQRAIEFPRKINYVSSSSLDILAGGGLYFPRVNPEWFSAMMKEGIRTGYFHTPSALRSPSPQLLNAEVI